jgi:type IV secretory pathway TraG/TraD family ATPase VirD4
MNFTQFFYDWTHGWHGLITAYLMVAVFQLAGQIRARASISTHAILPFTAIATLAAVGIAETFALYLLEKFAGLDANGRTEPMIAVILIMTFSFIGGIYWAKRRAPLVPVQNRGAQLLDGTLAQMETRKRQVVAAKKASTSRPLTMAGIAVPPEDETKHIKLMGTTGAGKSTILREVLHAALSRGDRAVIADPDGGYLSRFYDPDRGDVILNPFDARSAKWNLLAEIRTNYDVDQLARSLIPDPGGNGDPQWARYARTFFASVVRQAQAVGVEDLAELYRILTAATKEEIKLLVGGTPAAPFLEDGNEKMFGGIRSTTTENIKCLDYIREQTAPSVSVREWIRTGKGVLFLPYQADQIAALRSIISTWMRLAIFQTMAMGEGDHRLWFAVDELDALGAIDGLPDALARLRKFGGRCALGFQSIAQVSTTYGNGPAQAMVENCGNSLVLRCSASESGGTARFASRLIGEREIVRVNRSVNRGRGGDGKPHESESHSEQYAVESAVMASEIEQLPDLTGYLKFASQPAWMRVSFPVYQLPAVAVPFVPVQGA